MKAVDRQGGEEQVKSLSMGTVEAHHNPPVVHQDGQCICRCTVLPVEECFKLVLVWFE